MRVCAYWSVVALAAGCAAGNADGAASDPQAESRLQVVTAKYEELGKTLAAVPGEDRAQCELTAGDCLVLLDERRDKLVRKSASGSCEALPEAERQERCFTRHLSLQGKHHEATEYYEFANWCLDKVVACTAERAEAARLAALEQRFEERRQTIETSPDGLKSWNAVELTRARIEYLRSTLPPSAAEVCQPQAEADTCQQRFGDAEQAFHALLRPDDFDAGQALRAYAEAKTIEAGCVRPELECLSSAVASYGVFPESRKWVDQNFSLLAERQELFSRAAADVQSACLLDPAMEHQPRIVSAYAVYVKQPVLFFRAQLDKAFMALHRAQVQCLSERGKVAQRGSGPSGSARVQ